MASSVTARPRSSSFFQQSENGPAGFQSGRASLCLAPGVEGGSMRKTLLAVSLAIAASAQAQDQKAMMEAFQKAATPGPNHKMLEMMVGEWTFTNKMWMDPAAPPQESTGTSSYKSILGGRYVEHTHHGTMMGMPFEGRGVNA